MEKAKGPQFLRFCIPIVETLQELGGSGQPKEVTDTVLERLHISEREQAQTLKNGGSRVRNQVAWARFYLAKADLLDASRRGVWALTEKGRTVHLSPNAVAQIFKDVQANLPTKDAQPNATDDATDITPPMDPSGDSASKRTLLDVLKSLSPGGFERVSQRLLRESGFERVLVTGKSGDGGIDGHGILQVNPFVPTFKGVWRSPDYFVPLEATHTTSGQCPGHHRSSDGDRAAHRLGEIPSCPPLTAPS